MSWLTIWVRLKQYFMQQSHKPRYLSRLKSGRGTAPYTRHGELLALPYPPARIGWCPGIGAQITFVLIENLIIFTYVVWSLQQRRGLMQLSIRYDWTREFNPERTKANLLPKIFVARGKCRNEHYLSLILAGLAAFSAPVFLWVKIRYGHHLVASKYDIAAFSVHLGAKHLYFLLHSLGPGQFRQK